MSEQAAIGQEPDRLEPISLRAGPLRVDYLDGDLRYVKLGEREIARRVYVAVRDRNWGTVPNRLSNTRIEQGPDWFQIRYDVESRQREIDFAWQAQITGTANGSITFAFEGQARSTFLKNRLGLVILHPIRECAGAACRMERDDGQVVESSFPAWISPNRPFEEMRAIEYAAQPGVWAELRFAGDIFEMEDQRNWTDASFKTYSTPVRLGFPLEVPAGARVAQSVSLRLVGAAPPAEAARPAEPVISIGAQAVGVLPRLGLGVASHGQPLTSSEIERLRALRLSHLRADVAFREPDWLARLQQAGEQARELGVELELALHCSEAADDELARLTVELEALRAPVARWLIFGSGTGTPDESLIRVARTRLAAYAPAAPLVGGTNAYFAKLNSQRPPAALLDGLCYSINPPAHAFDTLSMMETFEAQTATVRSAQQFAAGKPLHISPVTLRPRFNPVATGPEPEPGPGELPSAVDPRQRLLEGAAWTVGALQALAEAAGVASVTLYETTGWRGVMEREVGSPMPQAFPSTPGMPFPLYHVLAALGALREVEVLPATSSHPLWVAALAYRAGAHQGAIVANLTSRTLTVRVEGGGEQVRVRRLDEGGGWSANNVGEVMKIEGREVVLTLGPYALVRLEARRADGATAGLAGGGAGQERTAMQRKRRLHAGRVEDRGSQIGVLHKLVADRAGVLGARKTHYQRDIQHLRPGGVATLAHVAVFAQRVAVVGGEDHQGVVQAPQHAQGFHQVAEPAIAVRDRAAVIGPRAAQLVVAHARHVGVVGDDLLRARLGQVQLAIVRRHQPGLVRVETFDRQKKLIRVLVLLQPLAGFQEHPRREEVGLLLAPAQIHDALLDKVEHPRLALAARLRSEAEQVAHFLRKPIGQLALRQARAGARRVHLAAAQEGPLIEGAPEVLRRLEHVVQVADQAGAVAGG